LSGVRVLLGRVGVLLSGVVLAGTVELLAGTGVVLVGPESNCSIIVKRRNMIK